MKPIVAHVHEQFLPISETFIYQFMKNVSTVRSVAVYADRRNEEQFPWDDVYPISYPGRLSRERLATAGLRLTRLKPYANSMEGVYLKAFRRLKPGLVHAHFGPEGVNVMQACRRLSIPLVVSFYGYDLSASPREHCMRQAYDRLFGTAAAIIALSHDFKQRLTTLGCPPEKVHVIRLGVDPDNFAYRDPQPGPEVRFFGTARLVEKKGTRYLLEALANVSRAHPHISYTHVGGGPLEAEMKSQAVTLGIADKCHFLGSQLSSVVRDKMTASDIFVLPSVTAENGDEEGTPVSIYEAMAVGLPVLSTYHSGIPEMVKEGVNGYLAPERDAETLAQNMLRLIENPAQWQQMARHGRGLVEDHFDVRKEGQKLGQIYQSLLSE